MFICRRCDKKPGAFSAPGMLYIFIPLLCSVLSLLGSVRLLESEGYLRSLALAG